MSFPKKQLFKIKNDILLLWKLRYNGKQKILLFNYYWLGNSIFVGYPIVGALHQIQARVRRVV